ncbi:MAG: branched-chain amino acid dehydrogenase, partial [Firmicutes bacterium]|nr:branched-chain amino acid dehydrogenase [Bacillota bacterium]
MKNKMVTAAEAVSAIKDGDMIAVGGFLGTGSPEILMDALVAQGTKHLTVIANDGGLNEENAPTNGKLKGIGKLLANHQIDHLIASHIG